LVERINEDIDAIRNDKEAHRDMKRSLQRQLSACIRVEGDNFENLI